jgi:predicted Zn-dependent peptidase
MLALVCLAAVSGCALRPATHPLALKLPPLTFSPPEAERVVLDCGAPLYLLPDRSLPLFSFFGIARAGSAYDPAGKEGLASLAAEVMRTGGTRRLSPDEVDRELEFMAAIVSTGASQDSASISMSCLSKDVGKALPLCLEILLHPSFAQDRIDLRKEQVRESIRRWNDEPSQIVGREFRRLVYGSYPYGHPTIGEPGSMARIARDDIIAFHRERLKPSGMIFGAAGDFDRDRITAMISEAFGAGKGAALEPLPPVTGVEKRSLNYIRKDIEQAHIIAGHLGIRRDNPDYFPVMIMNEILGAGSFSSRLIERVRDTEGLAYDTGTDFTSNIQRGLFYAVCQTKQESATRALSMILDEIERIRSEPVTPEELARAKESFSNSFVFRFTTASQIVEEMVGIEFFGLPRDYLKTYLSRVAAVTAEDVLRAAQTYLHPDRATILILGNREKFSEPLDAFGEVRVIPLPAVEPPR